MRGEWFGVADVVVCLQDWQEETGLRLPRTAEAIVGVEKDCIVDLSTGDVELLTDDWVVFAQMWRAECERRLVDVNYCRLALALERADTERVLGAAGEWEKYLAKARGLLLTR